MTTTETEGPFQPPSAPTDRPGGVPARRFNLGDILILVVAAAVFFALARAAWDHRLPDGYNADPGTIAFDRATTRLEVVGTGLVVASFTLVILRLRRPRPRLRLVMRQPGFLAALASSISSGVVFANDRLQEALMRLDDYFDPSPALAGDFFIPPFTAFPDGALLAGFVAVLVSWLILRWDGRWRTERSWLDWAGRFLGWAWLAMPLGHLAIRIVAFTG